MDSHQSSLPDSEKPLSIRGMFNAIAPTYDVLNHLLSFGLDIRWRRVAVEVFREIDEGAFLDIAAGSGDVSIELLSRNPRLVIAADFAVNMLHVFRDKLTGTAAADRTHLICCDALTLPFQDNLFDGTIVAFGIRNFADRLHGLREMRRILKPGGISVILELSTPARPVAAQCYALYTRFLLPMLGKIISRHNAAYAYLPASIASFPDPTDFLDLMRKAGFGEVSARQLSFGAATLYVGRRAA